MVWAGSGFLGWIGGETFGVDTAVHPVLSSLVSLPVVAGAGAVLVLVLGWGIRAARKRPDVAAETGEARRADPARLLPGGNGVFVNR